MRDVHKTARHKRGDLQRPARSLVGGVVVLRQRANHYAGGNNADGASNRCPGSSSEHTHPGSGCQHVVAAAAHRGLALPACQLTVPPLRVNQVKVQLPGGVASIRRASEPDARGERVTAAPGCSDNLSYWQHMVAGATAGTVEHVAMFPMDTIKTRMQALPHGAPKRSAPRFDCPATPAGSAPVRAATQSASEMGWCTCGLTI